MQNKKANYEIELKSSDLKVIEENILNLKLKSTFSHKTGETIIARKIKGKYGEFC